MADVRRDRFALQRNALRAALIVRGIYAAPSDERDDELDDDSLALLTAIEQYVAESQASRAWDPARHPRIPKGQPGAGRFLPMVDRLKKAIDTHFSEGRSGDPFDGFNREQLRRVARKRGIALERGESRDSIAQKLLDHIKPATTVEVTPDPPVKPTSTPSRMTKGQYTKLLKDEHVRLSMLDGKSEREAKAAARPAATIDELKARNNELRNRLRSKGVDYRTDEQKRTDDVEKEALLDEVQRLAAAGGYDGPAKRVAAGRMTVPELRKFIADAKEYQRRQAEKAQAAKAGAAAQAAFKRRQATLRPTDRQVDYILNLLARRARSGEGGGFFTGPTDRAGIAKLSRGDASAYIDSLTGNY